MTLRVDNLTKEEWLKVRPLLECFQFHWREVTKYGWCYGHFFIGGCSLEFMHKVKTLEQATELAETNDVYIHQD